jgi:hypothetical protein
MQGTRCSAKKSNKDKQSDDREKKKLLKDLPSTRAIVCKKVRNM